jgi:quercetin dioxygenase-like cupin family protein
MNDVSVIRHSDLPFRTIEGDGASGLQLARLYQNPEHALTFQLARVEPGGISKRHQHDWEQVNWVVSGKGRVDAGDETIEIGGVHIAPGTWIYADLDGVVIASSAVHS